MAFELPELPYDYDALAPYMSRETLEFHHDKHHKAYVDNGNKLAAEAGLSDLSLEEVVKKSFGTNAGLFNNAAQHYNHVHFWKWMKKGGGGNKLPGKLEQAIASDLGGYDKFKADFIAAGTTQAQAGRGCPSRTASSKSPRPRTAKTRWFTVQSRSSASTYGNTPTTSTTATCVRSTSKPSSTTSSTGTTSWSVTKLLPSKACDKRGC